MRLVICAVAVAISLCSPSFAQVDDHERRIRSLEQRVASLEKVIRELFLENQRLRKGLPPENQPPTNPPVDIEGDPPPQSDITPPPGVDPRLGLRVIRVEKIERLEITRPIKQRAIGMRNDARRFRSQAERLLQGDPNRSERREAKRLEDEAEALERDAAALESPDQWWVMGWDGYRDVMLYMAGRETDTISRLLVGDFVIFRGDEIASLPGHRADKDWFTIHVTGHRISKEAPDNWHADRPEDRKPIWLSDVSMMRRTFRQQ